MRIVLKEIFGIIIIIVLIGCTEKEINFNKLEEINEIYYEINKQEPFTGKGRKYYTNGQLEEEGTFKSGRLEGIYKTYYISGKLYSKISYKIGKKEGVHKKYFESGQLLLKETYKNDKLDGLLKRYEESGRLWEEEIYENGIYKESKRHYGVTRFVIKNYDMLKVA